MPHLTNRIEAFRITDPLGRERWIERLAPPYFEDDDDDLEDWATHDDIDDLMLESLR